MKGLWVTLIFLLGGKLKFALPSYFTSRMQYTYAKHFMFVFHPNDLWMARHYLYTQPGYFFGNIIPNKIIHSSCFIATLTENHLHNAPHQTCTASVDLSEASPLDESGILKCATTATATQDSAKKAKQAMPVCA